MANILYYPQCSMYDKQTKQLLPQADGNINMMRNTILEWKKYRPEDMFFILLPSELKNKLHFILPSSTLKAAALFYDSYVISARINRYNFNMNEISSILKDIKIDLLLNDVIEVTPNFKQMFKIKLNQEPKIISNIRHVDESDKSDYILDVLSGIIKSDLVTILSESMKPKLRNQLIEACIDVKTANYIVHNIQVFEPSISYKEIEPYTRNAVIKDKNKVRITFPGRLSKGEERRTNWDKFMQAILKLRGYRYDFEVYFTDPNNCFDGDSLGWIKTIDKDRNKFLNLLNQTDVIVSLMDVEGFGGISIREALLFNCLPIIPKVHEYKKMAEYYYDGFVESPINVDELVEKLYWIIDEVKVNKKIYDFSLYGMQFTVEEQFKKLLPKIEVLLNEESI